MRNMKRHLIPLFLILFLCCTICCGSSSSSDEPADDNPTIAITFRATANSQSADAQHLAATTVTPSEDYCEPAPENESMGSLTQTCSATPDDYSLGILGIYLVACDDAAGSDTPCRHGYASIADRFELFQGDQQDLSITSVMNAFQPDLAHLSGAFIAGGIQIVTAYVEQAFPTDGTSEGDRIAAALRGKRYRICTTPTAVGTAAMSTRCGNGEAQMGDYLVDLDGDGSFGFLQIDDATTVSELRSRPAGYLLHDEYFADQEVAFAGLAVNEYTTSSFYGTAGYFAPLIAFPALQTMHPENQYNVDLTFVLDNSFHWTDGAPGELADADTCVEALIVPETCVGEGKSGDSDPVSVGVYNPYYDTAFLPGSPSVQVTVTPLSVAFSEFSSPIGGTFAFIIDNELYFTQSRYIYKYDGSSAFNIVLDTGSSSLALLHTYSVEVRDGLAYIIGGLKDDGSLCPVPSGDYYSCATTDVWIYDPDANTFTQSSASLNYPRDVAASGVVDEEIYMIGGWNPNALAENTDVVERFDGTSWIALPVDPNFIPVRSPAFATAQDKIYIFGGCTETCTQQMVQIYDPSTNTFSSGQPMPFPGRHFSGQHAVTREDRFIYIFGGSNDQSSTIYDNVAVYDALTDQWIPLEDTLTKPRKSSGSALLEGTIWIFGGITCASDGCVDEGGSGTTAAGTIETGSFVAE